MARPYSFDLRQRVVAVYARGELTQLQIADQFGLGVATVGRWVRRAREQGSPAAMPSGTGPEPLIGPKEWKLVEALLRERPDATMQEVAWDLAEHHGLQVSRSTVQKAVQTRGWTPKKRRSARRSETSNASRNSVRSSRHGSSA